jgi:ABC-type multidrug transport system permease subunit
MLDILVTYRFGMAHVLGLVVGLLTAFCFEYILGSGWYISVPAALLAYILTAVLVGLFVGTLEKREMHRRTGDQRTESSGP